MTHPRRPTAKPNVEVAANMWGFTLRSAAGQLHIDNAELLPLIAELAYWLPPSGRDTKALLERLCVVHGIATGDLFPAEGATHG